LTAVAAATLCGLIIVACQKSDPDPNTAANAAGQYPPGYQPGAAGYPPNGQPQAGGYPAATGYPPNGAPSAYPTGAPTAYPTGAPTAYPTAPPPAGQPGAGGQMATPNQFALACQNDQACGLAHCNVPAGKCAFPCQNSAVDCIQGASCNTMTGFCLPGGG
jgi:hypothetical protein